MSDIVIGLLPLENEIKPLCNNLRNEYISKINDEIRKKESYTSWLILENLLKYNNIDPFYCYLDNNLWKIDGVNFSLSHDKLCGAIVSLDEKVSIDIIDSYRQVDYDRMFPIVANNEELDLISKINYSDSIKFSLLWCAKEALFKYKGDNKRFIPKSYSIFDISNIYLIDDRYLVSIKANNPNIQFINTSCKIQQIICNGKII